MSLAHLKDTAESNETAFVSKFLQLITNSDRSCNIEVINQIAMGKEVPDGCFGSVQRADVGMKYLALDGKKLHDAIGFEASIKITDVIDTY